MQHKTKQETQFEERQQQKEEFITAILLLDKAEAAMWGLKINTRTKKSLVNKIASTTWKLQSIYEDL
jgi:hypothetical protein